MKTKPNQTKFTIFVLTKCSWNFDIDTIDSDRSLRLGYPTHTYLSSLSLSLFIKIPQLNVLTPLPVKTLDVTTTRPTCGLLRDRNVELRRPTNDRLVGEGPPGVRNEKNSGS